MTTEKKEDRWRETLRDTEFQHEKRTISDPVMPAVKMPMPVSAKMPTASIPPSTLSGKKKELVAALFEIAEGSAELASETRDVVNESRNTRLTVIIAAAILVATSIFNYFQIRAEHLEREALERRIAASNAAAIAKSNEAIVLNKEVLDAVKAALKATTAANVTAAKVVASGTANVDKAVVSSVAASVAQAEVAALEVEEAVAPPAEKPAVRKRIRDASKKADRMGGLDEP